MPDIAFVTDYRPVDIGALELDYTYRKKTHRVRIENPHEHAGRWQLSSDTLPPAIQESFIRDAADAIRGHCITLAKQLLQSIREKRNGSVEEDARTDCL